jgi:hypothetical protein
MPISTGGPKLGYGCTHLTNCLKKIEVQNNTWSNPNIFFVFRKKNPNINSTHQGLGVRFRSAEMEGNGWAYLSDARRRRSTKARWSTDKRRLLALLSPLGNKVERVERRKGERKIGRWETKAGVQERGGAEGLQLRGSRGC